MGESDKRERRSSPPSKTFFYSRFPPKSHKGEKISIFRLFDLCRLFVRKPSKQSWLQLTADYANNFLFRQQQSFFIRHQNDGATGKAQHELQISLFATPPLDVSRVWDAQPRRDLRVGRMIRKHASRRWKWYWQLLLIPPEYWILIYWHRRMTCLVQFLIISEQQRQYVVFC